MGDLLKIKKNNSTNNISETVQNRDIVTMEN